MDRDVVKVENKVACNYLTSNTAGIDLVELFISLMSLVNDCEGNDHVTHCNFANIAFSDSSHKTKIMARYTQPNNDVLTNCILRSTFYS